MADNNDVGFNDLIEFSKGIPILALRTSARVHISNYLDIEGFVIGEFTNDWYGLAEVIGYSNQEIRRFEQSESPTYAVLDNWSTRSQWTPSIDKLIQHLLTIQRPDVITESEKSIRKDIEHYKTPRPPPRPAIREPVETDDERFDAFVVYANTDRDIRFTVDMTKELEGENHNLKLFIPGRDDLAGTDKYPRTAETIANKCRRVIVVLSKGFEHSEDCDFALKFAHSLSPGAKTKRIVPILIDNIAIPLILNFVGVVNFTNPLQREWVWPRVAATIKCPLVPITQDLQCTIDDLKNMKYESKNVMHMFYGLGVVLQEFKEEDEEGGDK